MAISNSASFGPSGKDPMLAMALSVVPGFGQLYNGESRKGLLFFLVTVLNCLALLLWAVRETLFKFFNSVATVMHISLNQELKSSLLAIKADSPLGYALILLLFCFTAYAMRDAFAKAHFKRLQAIYSSSSLAISEAAAGSYLMHFSFLFFVLLFVFFFCKQPPAKPQFTEITFVAQQDAPVPKRVVEHKMVSQRAAEATGKHNPMEKVTTAAKGSHASKPQVQTPRPPAPPTQTQSQPKTAAAPPKPQPMVQPKTSVAPPMPQQMPQPHPQPQAVPLPRPMAVPLPVPQPTAVKAPESNKPSMTAPRPTMSAPLATANPLPQPSLKSSDSLSKVCSNPLPTLTQSNNSLLAALPPGAVRHQSSSSSGQPVATGPIRDTSSASTAGSSAPIPVPTGSHSSNSGNSPGAPSAPQPKGVEGGHSGKSSLPTLAVAPAAAPGDNGTAKEGKGNPQANAHPDAPKATEVGREVDFSGFMADLQRRIKLAWFPPKAPASANCVLVFSVHLNGEMSGLRVQRSSGIAAYDNAAFKAVESAAPFRPLPAGAKEAVDVQFTFDYNVFQGGNGAFKRF
ncbi:MAG: TonB family protein [Candidatus Obscuribacterales bacterium]|nr:TonB family protein [Candidatus Obscuribacterales bacterium]